MRIIAGSHRGTKLHEPTDITRPTSDRVREAIFNVLQNVIEDATILDLFAGTGALGLEALSRGAASAVFVEHHPQALACLKKNVEKTSFLKTQIKEREALHFCQSQLGITYDLIFADPPYCRNGSPDFVAPLLEQGVLPLAPNGILILEVEVERETPELPHWSLIKRKNYGKTAILYLRGADTP